MTLTALYDACVLYPAPLRDLLIHLGRTGLIRARWTERINDEWIGSLLKNRPDLDWERLHRTRQLMNESILDSLVVDYDDLFSAVPLNDSGDRHVVAAAIRSRADLLVTFNLKHFPANVLAPYQLEAVHPDLFIGRLLSLDEGAVCDAVRRQRLNLRKPSKTPDELLETLRLQGLEKTVAALRLRIDCL